MNFMPGFDFGNFASNFKCFGFSANQNGNQTGNNQNNRDSRSTNSNTTTNTNTNSNQRSSGQNNGNNFFQFSSGNGNSSNNMGGFPFGSKF